jgi:Histidine kinase-, DNA gyrase B-, and HSP90-like ATPase
MATHMGQVELSHDHIERQARCSPERALQELIWNALDAGGSHVEVVFEIDEMEAVSAVEVRDGGKGITFGLKERAFGTIGESTKLNERATPEGRAVHGSEGRGRFKALVLGSKAAWTTTYREGNKTQNYKIEITRQNQRTYTFTDPIASMDVTGTALRIEGIDVGILSLTSPKTFEAIAAHFAMYLKRYPGVSLQFDRQKIDPSKLIQQSEIVSLIDPATGDSAAEVEIVEWTIDLEGKKLYICDEDGFAWHELPMGVQLPGMNVSAYLRWPGAREAYQANRLALAELDPALATVIEGAKSALRDFRKQRLAEQAQHVVAEWKKQNVYPFPDQEPKDSIERAERQVFDIVATRVHEFHEPLRSADANGKRLTLELVRQALETNPTSLKRILEKAIRLPKEKQDELGELLKITSFEAIIDAAKTVTQRLDVIHGFKTLIFDPDWKSRLLERTQLHRLLVHELWIFGEEYTLDNDDEPWKKYLKKHVNKLGREDLAPEVSPENIDKLDLIPDLLLSRRFLRHPKKFQNLVIELKRPSIPIGSTQIVQLEEYAQLVIDEDAFNKTDYEWTFVLIGNRLDSYAQGRTSEKSRPHGCVHQGQNHSVWVRQWSDIFTEAEMRYEFFRKELEIEASGTRGFKYLNDNYAHLLSGKGMTKKQEKQAGLL